LKFADGWILKWGASSETLAAHFVNMGITDYRRPDQGSMMGYFDPSSGTWRYTDYSSPAAVAADEPAHPISGNCTVGAVQTGVWQCRLIDKVPYPYVEAVATFDTQNRFYEGALEFAASSYDTVAQTLQTALGKPISDQSSALENGFGATFDQQVAIWDATAVTVILEKRWDKEPDKGWLTLRYKPIGGPLLPAPQQAQNPF
jgi:hypothetical protein